MSQLFAYPVQPADSDERYTPRWVFTGLGLVFDTDPCAPAQGGDCVPLAPDANRYTANDDGLAQPWRGLVWCNPPFSNATAFASKFIEHGNGIFLGPIANAQWTQRVWQAADLIWLCADFAFTHPTHAGKRSSMPLMFCALGDPAATGLAQLAQSGVHNGTLVTRAVATPAQASKPAEWATTPDNPQTATQEHTPQ
jgi:hypothetical protein